LKRRNAEADPVSFLGKAVAVEQDSDSIQWIRRVVESACLEEEIDRKTGSPTWWRRVTANQTPVTDRLGQVGGRIGP